MARSHSYISSSPSWSELTSTHCPSLRRWSVSLSRLAPKHRLSSLFASFSLVGVGCTQLSLLYSSFCLPSQGLMQRITGMSLASRGCVNMVIFPVWNAARGSLSADLHPTRSSSSGTLKVVCQAPTTALPH